MNIKLLFICLSFGYWCLEEPCLLSVCTKIYVSFVLCRSVSVAADRGPCILMIIFSLFISLYLKVAM